LVESTDPRTKETHSSPFSLAEHIDKLMVTTSQTSPHLVILDPLTAILGSRISASNDQQIREKFSMLARLARYTVCAVLIVRHLNKGSSENPLKQALDGVSAPQTDHHLMTEDAATAGAQITRTFFVSSSFAAMMR